jgi:hypothetical protein
MFIVPTNLHTLCAFSLYLSFASTFLTTGIAAGLQICAHRLTDK